MGKIWEPANNGLTGTGIWCLATNSKGDLFAGTWDRGVFRSPDNGANWSRMNLGMRANGIVSIIVTPKEHILTGTLGWGVFRSEDNGETWKQVNNGLTSTGANVWSFAVDSNGDILAGTTKGRIFRTSNEGDSWIRIDSGFSGYKGEIFDVRSIVINSKGHYFAGTSSGVFHSVNRGVTWSKIGEGSWTLVINSHDDFFTTGTLLAIPEGKEHWVQIKTKAGISSLALDSKGFMNVGTDGNGVLRGKKSTLKNISKYFK
jgi:ligand-binding sensor domain-containing protein